MSTKTKCPSPTGEHEPVHNEAGYVCLWCGTSYTVLVKKNAEPSAEVEADVAKKRNQPPPTQLRRKIDPLRQFLARYGRNY